MANIKVEQAGERTSTAGKQCGVQSIYLFTYTRSSHSPIVSASCSSVNSSLPATGGDSPNMSSSSSAEKARRTDEPRHAGRTSSCCFGRILLVAVNGGTHASDDGARCSTTRSNKIKRLVCPPLAKAIIPMPSNLSSLLLRTSCLGCNYCSSVGTVQVYRTIQVNVHRSRCCCVDVCVDVRRVGRSFRSTTAKIEAR